MDATDNRPCRGCTSDDRRLEEEGIRRMLDKIVRTMPCVPDDAYERRLSACRTCASLAHGHTCMHCGCIVAIRAKLVGRDCPHPASSRWN